MIDSLESWRRVGGELRVLSQISGTAATAIEPAPGGASRAPGSAARLIVAPIGEPRQRGGERIGVLRRRLGLEGCAGAAWEGRQRQRELLGHRLADIDRGAG